MANIKSNASFLDMTTIPKKKQYLNIFLKEKTLAPIHFPKIHLEEDSLEYKVFIVSNSSFFFKALVVCIHEIM